MRKKSFIDYMKLRERLVLALAVFLMFGSLGPTALLSTGVVDPITWTRLLVTTIASGGFAAAIVLSLSRPWLFGIIVPSFLYVITHTLTISEAISGVNEDIRIAIEAPVVLTPTQFANIAEMKMKVHGVTAAMIALGWVTFVLVMNSEARKRGRMESEIRIAQDIQNSLLPQQPLIHAGFAVTGKTIPTSEVGGDYYDYLPVGDGKVAVVIADVSGHGVGAGLIAAMTKSALYLQAAKDPSPNQVMSNLNEALAQITNRKTFVTCAYLLLDRSAGKVFFATAGHPPFLLKSGDKVTDLGTKNLALGVKRGLAFEQGEASISAGDTVLLYTDGISEASDRLGKPFGATGITGVMRTSASDGIAFKLIDIVSQFVKGEFNDDATVVSVEVRS